LLSKGRVNALIDIIYCYISIRYEGTE